MDFNEFESSEPTMNENFKYDDDIEFVVEQLNNMVHVGGRASRSVQLPVAFKIVETLKKHTLANEH